MLYIKNNIICSSSKNNIDEPFVIINGDDFYGYESFKVISDFYKNQSDLFSMVAFSLENTLSEFGSVSRGLCQVKNSLSNVRFISEITKLAIYDLSIS